MLWFSITVSVRVNVTVRVSISDPGYIFLIWPVRCLYGPLPYLTSITVWLPNTWHGMVPYNSSAEQYACTPKKTSSDRIISDNYALFTSTNWTFTPQLLVYIIQKSKQVPVLWLVKKLSHVNKLICLNTNPIQCDSTGAGKSLCTHSRISNNITYILANLRFLLVQTYSSQKHLYKSTIYLVGP